jgi:integrase
VPRADVRDVRFHDLSHTFGTRMAAQGMPMRVRQELMGHRDFKTTLIYADYAPSEREAGWIEQAFRPVALTEGGSPARPAHELLYSRP